jgi:hypothetical protein
MRLLSKANTNLCKGCLIAGFLPFKVFEPSEPGDKKTETEFQNSYKDRSGLTSEQRLALMWRRDPFGNFSPELSEVAASGQVAAVIGIGLGFYVDSKKQFDHFVQVNKHEMFRSPSEAQSILRNDMMKAGCWGSLKLGFRLSSMVLAYTAATKSLDVMRNGINPLEHAATGVVLGSIWRWQGGPRGMLSAGIIGGSLGLFEGLGLKALQWLSGETIEERFRRQLEVVENLNKQSVETLKRNNLNPRDLWHPDRKKSNEEKEEEDDSSFISRAIRNFRSKSSE